MFTVRSLARFALECSLTPTRRGASLCACAAAVLWTVTAAPAHAADPMVGVRSLAMGDSLRAIATGSEGLLLNPSGIATLRQFSGSAFYSLRAQSQGHFLHASVSDSVTNQWLAMGLYYNFIYESPQFSYRLGEYTGANSDVLQRVVRVDGSQIVRTGSETGAVVAFPLGDRFAIGGTLKYANYSLRSTLTPDLLPSDFTFQNQRIDGERNVDLGGTGHVISFDVGATLRLFDELRLGVVGQNLWAHGPELSTRLGLGIAYRFGERLTLAADAMIDFTGSERCVQTVQPVNPAASTVDSLCAAAETAVTYRLGLGGEHIIYNLVPVRVGYMFDSNLSAHHVSGGIGYWSQNNGLGIDFSLRQRVSAGSETVLLLALRIQR